MSYLLKIFIFSLVVFCLLLASFAYASYRTDKILDEIITHTKIKAIKPLPGKAKNNSWQYQLILEISNPTNKTLQITIDHLVLLVNNLKIGFLEPVKSWRQTVSPSESVSFAGTFVISQATLDKVQFQGKVLVQAKGRVSVGTSYLGFKINKDQFWDITKKMYFQ